jgi:hypothetical protein
MSPIVVKESGNTIDCKLVAPIIVYVCISIVAAHPYGIVVKLVKFPNSSKCVSSGSCSAVKALVNAVTAAASSCVV